MPPARVSRATSFSSMAQQLSLSVGAGTGALLLHLAATAHGDAVPGVADFHFAFMVVAAISALSLLIFLPLPADAGPRSAVSARHRPWPFRGGAPDGAYVRCTIARADPLTR